MKVLYFMTKLIWLCHTDTEGFYHRSNLELNMKVGYKLMQVLLGLFLMKLEIISTETNRYIYAALALWFLDLRNIFWINFDIWFTKLFSVSTPAPGLGPAPRASCSPPWRCPGWAPRPASSARCPLLRYLHPVAIISIISIISIGKLPLLPHLRPGHHDGEHRLHTTGKGQCITYCIDKV